MTATRDAAILQITRLGATAQKPVMSANVNAILDNHRLVDVNGVAPGADGWVETYNVNAAIAEVWASKAAAVAGDYTFAADDASFNKGDLLAHMLAMETKYSALGAATLVTHTGGSDGASTLSVAGTNGPFSTLDAIAAQVIP